MTEQNPARLWWGFFLPPNLPPNLPPKKRKNLMFMRVSSMVESVCHWQMAKTTKKMIGHEKNEISRQVANCHLKRAVTRATPRNRWQIAFHLEVANLVESEMICHFKKFVCIFAASSMVADIEKTFVTTFKGPKGRSCYSKPEGFFY